MNDWQPLGYGLEARLVPGSSVLVRNSYLGEQPHAILDLDDRGNILRLRHLDN
ncbi:MAG: hypothetical protein GVY17_00120 [Cyanobacteria bacterium]|jgi:hypothetical protein|nr:hypothetical protein [Cyanobacteria bacterium GSL.Bin21]